MKKLSLLVLSIIMGITSLSAQQQENVEQPKHAVGLAAGFSTGYGISYRYWPQKLGLQVTLGPFLSSEEANVSLGVTGLYNLRSSKYYNFFLYYSNHFLFEKNKNWYYNQNLGSYYKTERDFTWVTGAGPGFEIIAWGRLGFNGMFGLAYYDHGPSDWKVTMTVETGVFFKL